MKNNNLYAVLLGGKLHEDNLIEDHHLVFVIAENEKSARIIAKKRWNAKDIHIDGTQKLSIIDGYKINLEKIKKQENNSQINLKYSK